MSYAILTRYSDIIFDAHQQMDLFMCPIQVHTYNDSINMLGIYEMNQYVNLQLLSINSTERVDELLLERERYCTVSCHCGCTIWNESRFAWGRKSAISIVCSYPGSNQRPRTPTQLTHTYTPHTHNQVMLNNAEMCSYRVMILHRMCT